MMYFIPWVILLACVILAVPVASWLDGRQVRAEFGDLDDPVGEGEFDEFDGAEAAEGEPAPMEGEAADEFGGEGVFGGDGGFGGEGDFGGEDFSEFEEVK